MSNLVVSTKKGVLEGVLENNCRVFKGVPYAKAPVGDLRFRPPVEAEAWDGIRKADKFGAICPQKTPQPGQFYTIEFYDDPEYLRERSEDCLNLNIWAPEEVDPANPCPVAFWVHGGAFCSGYNSEIEFDGAAYAARGVILVTVNYRLGVWGFLNHPWLMEEDENGHCGNYGLLDQMAALRWVRENIAAFGGDPENITMFGQSAGAVCTQTLASSPLAKGLFHKAIMQSAAGYPMGFCIDLTRETACRIGEQYAKFIGASNLQELREKSMEEMLEAYDKTMAWCFQEKVGEGPRFLPTIDDHVLYHSYTDPLEKGLHMEIPYMIGSTARDLAIRPEEAGDPEKSKIHQDCIGWSLNEQRLGRKPAYVYYFNRELPGDDNGAFHSGDIWYMLGTLGRCWRPLEEHDFKLSEQMVTYWTNFMKSGDPNGDGVPEWKPCTTEGKEFMVLE